jgi:hypothetical protein
VPLKGIIVAMEMSSNKDHGADKTTDIRRDTGTNRMTDVL